MEFVIDACFMGLSAWLGITLIIFGIIGWTRTQIILFALIGRKPTARKRRVAAKSRPPSQLKHNRNRRGFGIAAVLYLLGLVGVAGGILFSNYMQSFVGMMKIQNGLTVRNDLMGASAALAAQSVFSADNTTLCPPRSVHQTTGDPCASAPVGLIQFQDFPSINNLPTNYANAGSTGLPTEVGVFAVGTNKQLDSYGHTYIYCRWENTRANPAAPAFVLISAGAHGILQTTCGDTVAQGDNFMISFPVAEAITHASLWQPNGTTNVSYGAAGTQVTVDASGDLTAAGILSAASAAITNGITAATLTTTGDITAKDFIGLATVSGTTGSFVSLNASSAAITNGITAATLATTGDISGLDLSASGTVSGNTGNFITLNASNAAITSGITTASLTASGAIMGASGTFTTLNGTNAAITNNLTAANITASGVMTGATGTFTTLNATNATVTGSSNLGATTVSSLTNTGSESIGGTLAVTGMMSGSNATYTGTVTAANFNGAFSGSYSGSTVTTTGAASLNSLSVTNNTIIGGTLGVSGSTTLAGLTASSVTNNGNLSVSGTSNLSGNLGIGCGGVNGAVALVVCSNNLAPIAYFSQAASDGIIGINSTQSGGGSYIVFDENYNDYWSLGKQEDQYGSSFYIWDYHNQKNLLLGLYPSGNLQLGEAGTTFITASGNVGIGTSSPQAQLDIEQTTTGTSGTTNNIYSNITLTPSASGTPSAKGVNASVTFTGSHSVTGGNGVYGSAGTLSLSQNSGATLNFGAGGSFGAINYGNGTTTNAYGVYGLSQSSGGTGTIANGQGGDFFVWNQSGATYTSAAGIATGVQNSSTGTITAGYGVLVNSPVNSGGGTFVKYYGVWIGTPTAAGTNYALYSQGGTNYFGGNVGIGTASPLALLHVNAPAGSNSSEIAFSDIGGANVTSYMGQTNGGSAVLGDNVNTNGNVYNASYQQWRLGFSGSDYFSIARSPAGATYTPSTFLYINNLGNIGIGTTSPAGIFDVEGGTAAASTAGTSIKLVAQNAGTGNVNGGNIYLTTGAGSGTGYAGAVLVGSGCSGASWLANGLCAAGDIYSLTGFAVPSFQPYGWGTSSANITGAGGGNSGDQIRFITNSVERGRFDGSGHFGIGTTSPQNTLDVNGAVAIGAAYAGVSTSPINGLIVQGNVGVGTALPQSMFQVYNGEVQTGSSGASCASANGGAIRYASNLMYYCNGSAWLPFKVTGIPVGGGAFVLGTTPVNGCMNVAISSITHSGTTATVSTGAAHGLASGATVIVSAAVPSDYNGTFTITVTGAKTFTYTTLTTPASNATTVGDFCSGAGGLAAANAICLSDLTNNTSWFGYSSLIAAGKIDSTHVQAFLCDGSTCQNPNANTTYYFASTLDATAGGSTFISNSSGLAPNDSNSWAGGAWFGGIIVGNVPGSQRPWTGRGAGTSTQWAATSSANVCNGWTSASNTYFGETASFVSTTSSRWANGGDRCGYNSPFNWAQVLICMVNP